jgi:hypothetical protein
MRRGSAASSVLQEDVAERDINVESKSEVAATQRHDILADLTKLQRDIDALRVQSEKEQERR